MSWQSRHALTGWIPWKISQSLCQWLYIGDKEFTEPFFDDTIAICRNLDENRKPYKVVSGLGMLADWSPGIDALSPSLIIFHVSRCGSTLLSQLLALDKGNIVLSEVPFFDELLRLPFNEQGIDEKAADNHLVHAVKYYGQKRRKKEKYLFIKADSWHLHFYARLRALFPSVPFVLLYRDPLEVIGSHQKQRGMQSVPGMIEPAIFNFSKEESSEADLDMYMANVLSGYFKTMIEISQHDALVLPLDYKTGMESILKKIEAFTGLAVAKESVLVRERIRFHAKHPGQLFKEELKDFVLKDQLAPLFGLYQQLESTSLHQ